MIGDRNLTRDDLPFPLDRPLTGQDLLAVLTQLLQPLWSQAALAVRGSTGRVAAVNAGPPLTVDVALAGQTRTLRYLASYSPTVGDTVLVLWNANSGVVLNKLA